MIGKKIRSLRHLSREIGNSLRDVFIRFDGEPTTCYSNCKAIKIDMKDGFGERMFIFNNVMHNGPYRFKDVLNCGAFSSDEVDALTNSFCSVGCIQEGKNGLFHSMVRDIILLPIDFKQNFDNFLSSNSKMLHSLGLKFSLVGDGLFSQNVYIFTNGSKNFYLWAVNTFYQNGTSFNTIKRIMNWNDSYPKLASKLSKKTITAYTSNNLNPLFNEMTQLRNEKRINNVINSFNTTQKKILRNANLSDKDNAVLSKFYRLSKTKKINFIRKVSTVDNFDELMRQLKHITSTHFEWNKESFVDFLKNVEDIQYKIVFECGDIMILKVENYETIHHLAKTTSWCISKNLQYWNQYVCNNNEYAQYVIFDFSKEEDDELSIIGFTTKFNKGITNAHNFKNDNILPSNLRLYKGLKSYISKYESSRDIYSLLNNLGLDFSLFVSHTEPSYNWDKESMYKYLYECVDKNNVDVLCDNNNLVALSVIDSNVAYFLGDSYIDSYVYERRNLQHIFFMDFSVSGNNPNRFQFAIIFGSGYQEEFCGEMHNAYMEEIDQSNFSNKLFEFGLPYDIIRRCSGKVTEIVDAYKTKSQIFSQYTGELQDRDETITVKYDFTKRPNSEFVAYFSGHTHQDSVGYARGTKTEQMVLNSLCTIGVKGSVPSDAYTYTYTPRDYGTDSQIALNVFSFDFRKKRIYVARVGNKLFKDREKTFMELSY